MNDKFLTLPEVATILRISKSSVYKYINTMNLPAMKIGKKWRFRKDQLDSWAERQNPNFSKLINLFNN